MKPLQVNDLQRARLALICLKLFPETPYLYFGKNWDRDIIGIGNYKEGEIFDLENKPQKIYTFHWFEFVMTHLFHKINYPPSSVNNSPLINLDHIMNSGQHPIDYLYKIFKNEMGKRNT